MAGTLTIIDEAGVKNLLDYEQTRNRLVGETTFYVTDDVLRESEQRFRAEARLGADQWLWSSECSERPQ